MNNFVPLLMALCLGVLLQSCSWVEVSPAAEGVRTAVAADVVNCKPMGSVTSNVLSKVGFIARNEYKVAAELEDLARDQAAKMGANVIVPESEVVDGSQDFLAYQC